MKIFTLAGLVVFSAATVLADTVNLEDMIKEKLAQQKKLGDMTVEQKTIEAEKPKLDAQAVKNQKTDKDLKTKATEWSMDNDANEAAKRAALNSGCRPGQKTTDTALVARCNPVIARINTETDRIEAAGKKLLADKGELARAQAQLTKDTDAWAARKKHNDAVMNDLNRRIAALTQYLSKRCTSIPANATDENVKHACGNIQFDGARPDLPPCETDECKAAEALFGRRAPR
jgi:peptidoglycan hydrolase CwlO-like protein